MRIGQLAWRRWPARIRGRVDGSTRPRTAHSCVSRLGDVPLKGRWGSRQLPAVQPLHDAIGGKWLAANLTDDLPAVIAAMFDEAERRDPAHERTWVALVDGNNQQIDTIRAQAATRGVTVTIVIDFVHVLEKLWKAAWTLFHPGDPDAEAWSPTGPAPSCSLSRG